MSDSTPPIRPETAILDECQCGDFTGHYWTCPKFNGTAPYEEVRRAEDAIRRRLDGRK